LNNLSSNRNFGSNSDLTLSLCRSLARKYSGSSIMDEEEDAAEDDDDEEEEDAADDKKLVIGNIIF